MDESALDAFRAFSAFFSDPVVLLASSGEIVAVNEAAARVEGLEAGRRLDALARDAHEVASYVRACRRVSSPLPGRLELRTSTGERAWRARAAAWPVGSSEARFLILQLIAPEGAVNPFPALTQRIAALNDEIRHRRETEEALRRSEAALREADRRKDAFLATLAHELRNPLAPIRTGMEILNQPGVPEPDRKAVREMIARQVEHLVRLVDDLMDVSRITRGKVELRRERVALKEIVEQAVEAVRPQRGRDFSLLLPAEAVYLDADRVRMTQVLSNLLDNARKYTAQGGRIWLSASRSGSGVTVRVGDDGIGIAPEQLARVFELFSQGAPGSGRVQEGLGIGLSLARTLTQMHGGAIEAHSAGPGKGSEFVLRLPALGGPPPGGDPQPAPSQPRLSARRVLVVDDNADAAHSLAALLRLAGNEAETALSGSDALEKAAASRPDVVLLDLGMPVMDGYDTCRAIREKPWGRDMVLVALTGWGHEEARLKSQQAGFDAHLTKPVEHAALSKLLDALCAGRMGR